MQFRQKIRNFGMLEKAPNWFCLQFLKSGFQKKKYHEKSYEFFDDNSQLWIITVKKRSLKKKINPTQVQTEIEAWDLNRKHHATKRNLPVSEIDLEKTIKLCLDTFKVSLANFARKQHLKKHFRSRLMICRSNLTKKLCESLSHFRLSRKESWKLVLIKVILYGEEN